MSDRDTADASSPSDAHAAAAEAFVARARSRFEDALVELYVFGSTVRGEARGLASDVDVLLVLDDAADREATADVLRDQAYDVMLEFGPVVELHVFSESEFERSQERGDPFVQQAVTEGRSYA